RFQQLYFGALNQITNVVDVFRFQAVGRTYGQLQVINRTQQDRIDLVFLLDNYWLAVALQVDERSQLLLQDGRCTTDRLFGIQSAVGFQVNDQFVQVGALLDTSILDHISHTTNRTEGGVELQTTDATA